MKRGNISTMYKAGLLILLPVVILGELLWVIDPLRLPGGWYLIDYIHILVSGTAVIPLLWAGAAVRAWHIERGAAGRILIGLRVVIIAASVTAASIILTNPKQIIALGASLGAAIICILLDLFVSEYSMRRSYPRRTAAWFACLLVSMALLLCPTGYLVTYPGITMDMNRYAHVENGEPQSPISGVLIFERPAFPIDWLFAAVFPHYSFERQEDLGMSLGEYNQAVRVMKHDANTVAAAVALGRLGIGDGVTYEGVIVAAVMEDSPANGKLLPGDKIIEMNGHEVRRSDQLLQIMESVAPGQEVDAAVVRDQERIRLRFPTAEAEDDPERAVMGVQIVNDIRYDVSVGIDYTPYMLHEGGPSHGAMLTLAIIDQLTPGGVTNGNHVAGTGTIQADGSIGRIGGIRQKAFTVERSGADVFFVPEGQEEEARQGARKLEIVPVRTIDDILNWLAQHPGAQERV